MKLKELLTVLNSKAYVNIVTHRGYRLFVGQSVFITPELLERRVVLVDVIINEFFIMVED